MKIASFMQARWRLPVQLLIFLLYAFFVYTIMVIPQIRPTWDAFPDANDYLKQSQQDFLSMNFFSPSPAVVNFPRPFTTPLLYKLADGDFYKAVMFQKLVYCLCVFLFCQTLLLFIQRSWLKVVSVAMLLFYFTWWNIVGWTDLILSESASQSFFLAWLSSLLFFLYRSSFGSLLLVIFCSILFSFTRDTWPYLLLMVYALLLLFWWRKKGVFKRYLVCLFFFGIALFAVQQYTARIGERYKLPLLNIHVHRIISNPTYTEWFKQEGTPQMETLVANYRNNDLSTDEGINSVYRLYCDSLYKPLRTWTITKGKSSYMKFMLLHPSYFFLMDQSAQQKERIYVYNLKKYLDDEHGFFQNAKNAFPIFNNWVLALLMLGLLGLYFWRERTPLLLLPLLIVILTIANVYLTYNADTMEVERHLFITTILLQLSGILAVILILNTFLNPLSERSTEIPGKLME